MPIATLHDKPTETRLKLTEKITIRKGEVTHEPVWVDRSGQEYDRVNQKFIARTQATKSPRGSRDNNNYDENDWIDMMCLMFLVLCTLSVFLWGFLLGRMSVRSRTRQVIDASEWSHVRTL